MSGPMPRTKDGFLIDATAGELNRRIGYDFRAGFVALAKLAVSIATLSPMALADAAELTAAIRREPASLEIRAWVLIRQALGLAMAEVAIDALKLAGTAPDDPQALVATLDLALEGERVLLTPGFFDFPAQLSLIGKLKRPLRQWLEGFGLEPEVAAQVTHNLGARFTAMLDFEWGRHPDDYAPLKDALDTPFTRGSERERGWLTYHAYLDAQLDEPIFGETFGLRAVYIPLRAYYEEPPPEDDDDRGDVAEDGTHRHPRRVVIGLEGELRRWLGLTRQERRHPRRLRRARLGQIELRQTPRRDAGARGSRPAHFHPVAPFRAGHRSCHRRRSVRDTGAASAAQPARPAAR